MRPARSLKAKALQLLAQREQSRLELRRKLLTHARSAERADAAAVVDADADADVDVDADVDADVDVDVDVEADRRPRETESVRSVEAQVDEVLAWLDAHQFASDERFAESRIHAREGRFGNLRIRHELATHAVALSAEAARKLAGSELQRALDVCERKYPLAPTEAGERARQGRFLIARGFSGDVVRQALRQRAERGAKSSADTG